MKQMLIRFLYVVVVPGLSACSAVASQPEVEKMCTSPRPEVCTMDYAPVCGIRADSTANTYSNACSACSDPKVIGYNTGECPG